MMTEPKEALAPGQLWVRPSGPAVVRILEVTEDTVTFKWRRKRHQWPRHTFEDYFPEKMAL